MSQIHLYFLEGFNQDDCRLTLNDEVIMIENLTTDYSSGIARIMELFSSLKENKLRIEHVLSKQTLEMSLSSNEDLYIEVSLLDNHELSASVKKEAPSFY